MKPETQTPAPVAPRKPRLHRWFVVALGMLAVLPALGWAVAFPLGNEIADRRWDAFRRDWEAKGEVFSLDVLLPPPRAVPDARNFARHPLIVELADSYRETGVATGRLTRLDPFADGRLVPPKSTEKAAFRAGEPLDLAAYLPEAAANAAVEMLRRLEPGREIADALAAGLAERSAALYPYDREMPYATVLPHAPGVLAASKALRLESIALAQSPDGARRAESADRILALLRLIRLGAEGDGLVPFTMRTVLFDSAGLEALWHGLRAGAFTDGQLAAADAELARFEFRAQLLRTLRFERAALIRQSESRANLLVFPGMNSALPRWTRTRALLRYADATQRYWFTDGGEGGPLRSEPNLERILRLETETANGEPTPENVMLWFSLPALRELGARALEIETQRRHARFAVALERHRLRTGVYPETLEGLGIGGDAPRYVSEPDGYRLESPALAEGASWVWRQRLETIR
ncbi:MAG: hypothetical protein H7A52_06655 [Akkermansiaceae bacterium]|nr:hypothetical protein [Akkermansiaceae bacterium]